MANGCPSRSRREEPPARSSFQKRGNTSCEFAGRSPRRPKTGGNGSVFPSTRCRPLASSWNRATDGQQDGELIARGGTELQPDHTLIGRLGPADRVEVYRGKARRHRAWIVRKGMSRALLFWDITPAGDQVRARFTFHQPRNRSTIRFAHQQGLILRSARVAGLRRHLLRGRRPPRRNGLCMSIPPCKPARRSSSTAGCPSSRHDGWRRQAAVRSSGSPEVRSAVFLACSPWASRGIPDRSAFAVRETGRADSIPCPTPTRSATSRSWNPGERFRRNH